jgi:hypothetical protein
LGQEFDGILGAGRVDASNRFVSEQDPGFLKESAGDRDALLLTAGEMVGALENFLANSNSREDVMNFLEYFTRGSDHVSNRSGEGVSPQASDEDVLPDTQVGQQAKFLVDKADSATEAP